MRDEIPAKLAVSDAVARGLALEGDLSLDQLPRLVEALASPVGTLHAALRFAGDSESLGRLRGHLTGELQLQCQRCLNPTAWPLQAEFDLSLVDSEDDEERLLESREPVLVENGQVELHELLEDEALLALPLAPTCADAGCADRPGETRVGEVGDNDRPGDSRPNPFLALKGKFPSR